MTKEEAEKYADNMTYRDAINNLMKAKSIPYRKATFIKVNELLKALEQEPKWIFVSERVPNRNGKYLVTRYNGMLGSLIHILSYAENLYDIDRFDFNEKKGKSGWYDYDPEWGYTEFDDVIAWMPLPAPVEPKERSEDKWINIAEDLMPIIDKEESGG